MTSSGRSPSDFREALRRVLKPTAVGKFIYRFMPIRKSIVMSNLHRVFGNNLSPEEVEYLAEAFYSQLALLLWENLTVGFLSNEAVRQKIRLVGVEEMLKAAELGKGIIILTGHFGNWEYSSIAASLNFPQFRGRLHVIRRPLVNKWVERIVFKRFYDAGMTIVPKKNSVYLVLDHLSRNDAVFFIMDQYAKPGRDGIEAEFFGTKTGTFKSLALVAQSSGAPVVPMVSYREAGGAHVQKFLPPVPWISHPDPDEELLTNTRNYNRVLENFILNHPDQWLWLHRRWKKKPAKKNPAVPPV